MVLNPMQLMELIKGGNPKGVVTQIINTNFPNDPNFKKLLEMGEKQDIKGIEQFAQNYFGQQGRDFNQELNYFMTSLNNLK